MRLLDLKPRWLEHAWVRIGMMFLCPHCAMAGKPEQWLSCAFVPFGKLPMVAVGDENKDGSRGERLLFAQEFEKLGHADPWSDAWEVVSCQPDIAWKRTNDDFGSMSITPSIDASASGHWHGSITNGKVC